MEAFQRVALRLIAFFMLSGLLVAADVGYSRSTSFVITKLGETYELRSETTVRQAFLSEPATHLGSVRVAQQAYSEVNSFGGELNGARIPTDRLSYEFPKREDVFFSPSKIHELTVPRKLKVGDVLTHHYNESYQGLAFFPIVRVPALDRVDRFEVLIQHPQELEIGWHIWNLDSLPAPAVARTPGRTSLVFRNFPVFGTRAMDPYAGTSAALLFTVRLGEKWLTPSTPLAFANWYHTLCGETKSTDSLLRNYLADKLNAAKGARAKARILFDHVKKDVRYIADEAGMGAIIPRRPEAVLASRRGDCKDKAYLLVALGNLHGLKIHPVLVSTEPTPPMSGVHLSLYNHMICVLEDQGELIYMDPTWRHGEFGVLPDPDVLQAALLLDPEKPRLVSTPGRRELPDVDLRIEGDLANPQVALARVSLRHTWLAQVLEALESMKALDFENNLSNRINSLLFRISLDHFKVVSQDGDALVLEAEADLSEFLVRTDLRIYVPGVPFRAVPAAVLERSNDEGAVDSKGPNHFRLELSLKAPGQQIHGAPLLLGKEGEAIFRATTLLAGDDARFTYTYYQPHRVVPRESRAAFLAFCSDYLQMKQRLFSLQRKQP